MPFLGEKKAQQSRKGGRIIGPSKPTGNVGQPANGNLQYLSCQCEIG
ncbi:hypothetical protein [Acinetobacter baumannii]|nr:hypothetical protein [Acinetobacter baumannii]